jgi:PAS domain S-box-containing protein
VTDVKLSVVIHPQDGYEWSGVLLAKANFDGTLELLTRGWERLLGYGRRELDGKALRALMAAEREGDGLITAAVAAIFDEHSTASVELTLRCRSGARKWLRLHRRLDTANGTVYIVGEEVASAMSRPSLAARRGVPANRRSAAPPPRS